MKKMIVDLWNGNLEPIATCGRNNAEIKKVVRLIERNRDKLVDKLDEKQKVIFEKYDSCINEYLVLITEQAFSDGYSVGSKLLAEALIDED